MVQNNALAWTLLTVCAAFNVLGGTASKAWSKYGGVTLLAACVGCFLADLLAWIGALYYQIDLAKGTILFTSITLLLSLAAAFYFDKNPLRPMVVVGAVMVLAGSVLAALGGVQ